MNSEQWLKVRDIFESALEQPADRRPAFLESACAGDDGLLKEVRDLLDSFEQSPKFMTTGISAAVAVRQAAAGSDALEGTSIGPWKLLRRIGSGGMGAVYAAARVDQQFQKIVAIKVVKPGMDSEEILRRFRNERQVLASLEHPNITRLVDGGTTDYGLPYLVMEYVEGTPIDRYCDSHKLSVSERLVLFRAVCAAVQYAHQNLVVHRDLKPANIMVTSAGVPKLLDFGIAKLLRPEYSGQSVHLTRTSLRPMTPEYASPEQVRGEPITTASDVYSLGVILYMLLTGTQPYRLQTHTATEIEAAICEWEPELPSVAAVASAVADAEGSVERLRRRLRGDLDVVVQAALRKEAQRRYASVERFSTDIALHLSGSPVSARKDTWRYRMHKFAGRHKAGVAVTLFIGVAMIASTAVSLYFAGESQRQKEMTLQLVGFMLGDFDAAMESGITSARKSSLDRILGAIEALSPNAASDPALRKLLIKAYLKAGDLQGNVYETNLGDAAGAQQSYQKALQLAEAAGLETSRATAKQKLADITFQGGDRQAALGKYLEVQSMWEGMLRKNPGQRDLVPELRRIWYKIGLTQSQLGDMQGSLLSYQRELQFAEQWSRLSGAGPESRREVALAEEHIGNTLANKGNAGEGLIHLRRAIATYEDLRKIAPSSVAARRDLALALLYGGDALMQMERLPVAETAYRNALVLLRSLAQEDPHNDQYQRDLHSALDLLARVLVRGGRMQEARKTTEELLVGLRPFIDRPDLSAHDAYAYCWTVLKTPFKDLHDPPAALQLAQRAVDLTRAADPGLLDVLALAWEENGDLTKAIEAERRAIDRFSPQAGKSRKQVEIEANLARFERTLAKSAPPVNHQEK